MGIKAPLPEITDPTSVVCVESEVGALRRVIVHRPGDELGRAQVGQLGPHDAGEAERVDQVREQHDALTAVLTARGVEVVELRDLLEDSLGTDEALKSFVRSMVDREHLGEGLADAVNEALTARPRAELADLALRGATFDEIAAADRSLVTRIASADDLAIAPLPHAMYTRDSAVVVGEHAYVSSMTVPARSRESAHAEHVWRHHPELALRRRHGRRSARNGERQTGAEVADIQGGDVLVAGNGCVVVGIGEHTSAAAVERIALSFFERGSAREVLAVPLPHAPAARHLDSVLTMIDWDAFAVHPEVAETLEAYRLRPGREGAVRIDHEPQLFPALARAMRLRGLLLLETGHEASASSGQSHDANNLLVAAPGVVVSYEDNAPAIDMLSRAGYSVIAVPGSELSRRRRGPRCITCPILRSGGPRP